MRKIFNPYVIGNAVYDDETFFGRTDILDWVVQALHNIHNKSLVLAGQRRIGKTSLLRRLEQVLPEKEYLPVYFDLLDQVKAPLKEVLVELADRIAWKTGSVRAPSEFDDRGRDFIRSFVPSVLKTLAPGARLVILVDEFEVEDHDDESELSQNSAVRTLHPFFRQLMDAERRIAFVFATGRRTRDLDLDFQKTFRSTLHKRLWILEPEETEELIYQAHEADSLRFTREGVERVLSLTKHHPYLTQLLCYSILEVSYIGVHEGLPPPVGAPEVDLALAKAFELGEGALEWLWKGLGPAERVYAAAMASVSKEGEAVSVDATVAALATHASRRTQEVLEACEDLVARQILYETQDDHYQFEFEILRRWVKEHKPLRMVDIELDQLNVQADRLYVRGAGLLRAQEADQRVVREHLRHACELFREAVEIDPYHFRAWLDLGKALLKLDAPKAAIEALETATRLDRKRGRLTLVDGLVRYAEGVRTTDEHLALTLCERALKLSPTNVEALKIRSDIWTIWGNRALQRKDEDEALIWYRRAKNDPKVRGIVNTRWNRKQTIEPVVRQMRNVYRKACAVTKAFDQSAALTAGQRHREIWLAGSRVFKQQARMIGRIVEALEAIRDQKKGTARRVLHLVAPIAPVNDYKEHNAHLRAQALERPPEFAHPTPSQVSAERQKRAARACLEAAVDLSRALEKCISQIKVTSGTDNNDATYQDLWRAVLKRLDQKEHETHDFLAGTRALYAGDMYRAQEKLGLQKEDIPR